MRTSPELFFSHGDPGLLSVEFRRQLLDAYVVRFGDRQHTWTDTNRESLARFADNALEPDLSRIAGDATLGEDTRLLALWLVRHGRISGCVETALNLAVDDTQSIAIRTSAAAIMRDIADTHWQERLAQCMGEAHSIPPKLLGIFIEAVFPSVANVDEVASFVRKVDGHYEELIHGAHWLLSHFEEQLSPRNALDLLAALMHLAEQTPRVTLNGTPTRLSTEFQWLGRWFPELLRKAVQVPVLSQSETGSLARAWAWLEEFSACTNSLSALPDDFSDATKRHPKVRREYFWLRYQDHLDRREGQPQWAFQFLGFRGHGGFVASAIDVDWLLTDVEGLADSERQQIALGTCFDILQANGRRRSTHRRLKNATAGNEAQSAFLRDRLRRARFPRLKRFWYGIVRQKLTERYWWDHQWWKVKQQYRAASDFLWLHRNLRSLRSGQRADVLADLAREAVKDDGFTRVAPTTWEGLRKKRGRRIADAVNAGCRQVWQEYTPQFPYEKDAANTSTSGDHAGLAGLSTGIACGEINIASLSNAEVEKAVRYATTELNGFPEWFSQLVEGHPATVRQVFVEAVSGEWNWSEDHAAFGVLYDICWGDVNLREMLANDLVDRLEQSEPSDPRLLQLVLQSLVDAPTDVLQRLSELCTRILDDCPYNGPRFTQWCVTEVQLDPDRALTRLEILSPDDPQDVETALDFIAILSGEDIHSRLRLFRHAQPLTPQQTKRLLLFCHRLVNPANDIKRTGAHSPTRRDHAQRFRDSLLSRIAENERSDTPGVLRSLLEEPDLHENSDYVLELIGRRRRADFGIVPWTESDVSAFAEDFETDPKSDEELYLITRRRLTDLRYQVEKSDNSLRDEVRSDHDEKALCRWIARKLVDRSRDRYVTTIEIEIDQEERPDLRTERPDLPPVPIEVKWAENWSYNELAERLENQLIGQYLRARDNRYGILLLGYLDESKKKHWRKDTGDSLAFAQLLEDLQSVADHLVERNADVNAVVVVGIDFRKPE